MGRSGNHKIRDVRGVKDADPASPGCLLETLSQIGREPIPIHPGKVLKNDDGLAHVGDSFNLVPIEILR